MPRDQASTNQMASEGGECWENPLFFLQQRLFFVCVGTEMFYFEDLSQEISLGVARILSISISESLPRGRKTGTPTGREEHLCVQMVYTSTTARVLMISGHDDAFKKSGITISYY